MKTIITDTSRNVNNFDSNFVNQERISALQWVQTPQAKSFIYSLFPEYTDYICNYPDKELNACYTLFYKSSPLFIDEASVWGDLCVHMKYLFFSPKEYFGISGEELPSLSLKIDTVIPNEMKRLERQGKLIKDCKPILQPEDNGRCIPIADRFTSVHTWYNDTDKLAEMIELVGCKVSFVFGWASLLGEPPCSGVIKIEKPYGLEQRVNTYIDSLSIKKRRCLLKTLGGYFTKGFWVKKAIAVRLLTRVLTVEDPEELKKAIEEALKYRITQSEEALKMSV